MRILGLNAYHPDAAACLLEDGHVVAAAEEERFVREKHHAGLPIRAARFCLEHAGATGSDLDAVAINTDPRANRTRRILFALTGAASPRLVAERLRARGRRGGLMADLERALGGLSLRTRLHHVEHHRAHLASAFYCSPFADAAAVSVDGFGDFTSAAWGTGSAGEIDVLGRTLFPHSLGIFYQAITQFLGFDHYGDEYKVMGLAAYGEPGFMPAMEQLLRLGPDGAFSLDLRYFRHHRVAMGLTAQQATPVFPCLYTPSLESLLGERCAPGTPVAQRQMDIAASAQRRYEEALGHLLRHVHEITGLSDLALAGGCAMNSLANGRVQAMTSFQRLYVQPAAGDAGGALGAALCAHRDMGGVLPRVPMSSAALGPGFDDGAVAEALAVSATALDRQGCTRRFVPDVSELCRETAAAIADGEVVGWFQGRMEWGPRALGQRSILADPRRADMRDVLNHRIKRREAFRPFGPSVLREAVADWFEGDHDVPFMTQVVALRRERRATVPAVTHADGTGRLQTVSAVQQPLYHQLIATFASRTGVPMVLNTSFNESEPIVCNPGEAIACFLRTRMDRLVLGRHVIARPPPSGP